MFQRFLASTGIPEQKILAVPPVGRLLKPAESCAAVRYLASDDARFVTTPRWSWMAASPRWSRAGVVQRAACNGAARSCRPIRMSILRRFTGVAVGAVLLIGLARLRPAVAGQGGPGSVPCVAAADAEPTPTGEPDPGRRP